jgi:hypothetical protein
MKNKLNHSGFKINSWLNSGLLPRKWATIYPESLSNKKVNVLSPILKGLSLKALS